jgi:hypothetical protein
VRTTVTPDPDLAAKLQALARERGASFKDVLNGALRLGLMSGERGDARPYRLRTRPMGLRRGIELDKALRLAAELEDAETVRKLELRK